MSHHTSHPDGRGIILAFASAAGFSTLSLFAKLIYAEGFSVQQTLAWRFTLASVFLLILVYARHSAAKASRAPATAFMATLSAEPSVAATGWASGPLVLGLPRARLLPVILLGLFGFAPQAGLFFLTVKILDPGITGLLLYLYPSFVVLFSFVFLKKKPVTIQILALVLSLGGCALTFFKAGRYPAVGLALGAFVALAYAAYLVAGEKVLAGLDPVGATAVIMLVAAIVYWTFVIFSGIPPRAPKSLVSILGFLGVSLVSTVLPITTLFMAMERIGAADTSLVSTVEPVFTLIMSALLVGERLGAPQLAGGALILSAVILLRFAPAASATAFERILPPSKHP